MRQGLYHYATTASQWAMLCSLAIRLGMNKASYKHHMITITLSAHYSFIAIAIRLLQVSFLTLRKPYLKNGEYNATYKDNMDPTKMIVAIKTFCEHHP